MLKTLQNWFMGLIKFLTNIFTYPICILPHHRKYIWEIDFDTLVRDGIRVAFVRRSNKPNSETFDELGFLREDAISPKEVPGLSMNTLGNRFRVNYIKFIVKKPGSDKWIGIKIRYTKYLKLLKCIELANQREPIFFFLADLHDMSFPYKLTTESRDAKKVLKALGYETTKETKEVLLTGRIKIKHVPNNLNYWHAEIHLIDAEKKEIPQAKNAWTKSAAEYALTDLIVINGKNLSNYGGHDCIDTKYYQIAI